MPPSAPAEVAASSPSGRLHGLPWPVHPVLVPLLPVLVLWSGNAAELRTAYPARVAAGCAVAALVVWAIVSVVQRDLRRSALVATVTVTAATTIGYLLRDPTAALLNLLGLAAVIAFSVVVSAVAGERKIRIITHLANVVGAATVIANVGLLLATQPPEVDLTDPPAQDSLGDDLQSVWYLVPDRYPGEDVLAEVGVDVRPFVAALRERGFQVVEDARANYPNTRLSLASAWGLDYLAATGGRDLDAAVLTLADPPIGRVLDGAGYHYTHLGSWSGVTSSSGSADRVLTLQGANEFWTAWEQRTILPTIRFLLDVGEGATIRNTRQVEHARHQFRVLEDLARREPSSPEFVLAHLIVPHGPYVFRSDGSRRVDRLVTDDNAREGYADQVAYVNDHLLEIVDILLARDRPPLVVIMADEGLYPESLRSQANESETSPADYTDADVRRKMSILAAVHDPSGEVRLDETTTAVNIVRAAISAALGSDAYPPLPDVSYRWDPEQPSHLVRIEDDRAEF